MIDYILEQTDKFILTKSKAERKIIGQFFTSKETATFMASLFIAPQKDSITILDPGAGSGILSAAVIDRLQFSTFIKHINLTCYENNPAVIDLLESNLEYIKRVSKITLDYCVITDNYITSQREEFNSLLCANNTKSKYDFVIGNPPYIKILKDAPEAQAMPAVCYGAPNLYFLFASMSLFNLMKNGEMVFIIPRSWTSGAYFRKFREYFLSEGRISNIHLFVSRDKVFDKEEVLQETIIVKIIKTTKLISTIQMTSSKSNHDFHNISKMDVPYDVVVNGEEKYVYLVTSQEEIDAISTITATGKSMPHRGLKMKTGLTVDFRCREFLRQEPGDCRVPLFYSQHIQDGRVVFPMHRQDEYITTEVLGLIQKNKNYLFVKRFTAKEERRRLQCGMYFASTLPEYSNISTQNKVNFIDRTDGELMNDDLLYGIYVIFNSSIYDLYYRILNGSTQVNSTEVNSIPIPELSVIERMGSKLKEKCDLNTFICDEILEEELNECNRIRKGYPKKPWTA